MMYLSERDSDVVIEGEHIHLTPKEYQILWLLNSREGQFVTEDEMRQFLYDDEEVDAPLGNVVEAVVSRLRKKLSTVEHNGVKITNEQRLGYKLERT